MYKIAQDGGDKSLFEIALNIFWLLLSWFEAMEEVGEGGGSELKSGTSVLQRES